MREAVSRKRCSNSYRLFRDGTLLTEIGPALSCQVDGLTIGGRSYTVRRGRFGLIQTYLLEVNGSLMAQAQPSHSLGRQWSIRYVGHEQVYRLRPRRPLAMTFVLERNGILLEIIRPQIRRIFWPRKAAIDVSDLPLPIVCCCCCYCCLVMIQWQREQAAASGG
ncbi:MAG: hypothetical protein IMW90_17065 [Thermogemmatispora sp.]|uniref:hypothetical protein n=1 Tax=Thermogemmatispora sp. TaxID=1968838 RepID=UPI0019E861AE|nr:hypothetical protein [Thermogemmatispora sp.]MBE3567429.1 hypothetical protein [Thermogemmatispora sp.]